MTPPSGGSDPIPSAVELALRKVDAQNAADALRTLHDAEAALSKVTGGASPRQVLAELAQQLAAELAQRWDELPGHRFSGRVARAPGVLGAVIPGRRVAHRVVLARYLSSTAPKKAGGGYLIFVTTAAVLGLGTDGVLRAGKLMEAIRLREPMELPGAPVRWDDERIRGVPSRRVWLGRWRGGGDPLDVAAPGAVLDALAALASRVAEASRRDLELLQRLLGTGE